VTAVASWWVTPAVVAVAFLCMLGAELFRPLRPAIEPKVRRIGRNLSVAVVAFAFVNLVQIPILLPVSLWVQSGSIGLLPHLPLGGTARTILAVVLLDYTLWHWHVLNHKIPFFWRFHLVHHVDLDLDASTALRFHFGELGLSVFYRAAQVVVIGAEPLAVWIWQTILFVSILFHHSDTRLPIGLERVLVKLIVTPRMHGIHHSVIRSETDSNWSSLLSVWDVLHGTLLLNVPQDEVVIGVPAFRTPDALTFGNLLALPFRRQRKDWVSPDGREPTREHDLGRRAVLRA
jgi:sterol desaturase/sphingolipid hydroxylase (fatty acid hydroxylase superfamily)